MKVPVYFTDPYSSWQKGAVENANKLIRQYIPKGATFKDYSDEKVKEIQHKLNRRPREKLDFSNPKIEFYKIITKLHLLVDSRTLLFRLMYIQSKQFMILAPTIREVSTNKAVNAGDKYPHQMYFPALLLIFFQSWDIFVQK